MINVMVLARVSVAVEADVEHCNCEHESAAATENT